MQRLLYNGMISAPVVGGRLTAERSRVMKAKGIYLY